MGQDQYKQSYIIAISSLEIVLNEFLEKRILSKDLGKFVEQFKQLKTKYKFSTISLLFEYNEDEIRNCLVAIEIRNKIVHERIMKKSNHKKTLNFLFQTISKIIHLNGGILPKFPRIALEPYSKD
jgi:dephospho-CoA kinase